MFEMKKKEKKQELGEMIKTVDLGSCHLRLHIKKRDGKYDITIIVKRLPEEKIYMMSITADTNKDMEKEIKPIGIGLHSVDADKIDVWFNEELAKLIFGKEGFITKYQWELRH